ncbi:hypothetical protein MKS88_005887 [Plasmodium brasilianum]|uniref:Uncharacterized protein n=1 Tax=Plasmodium brasilianum TaxID=5824 RepID=A0ACB9Y4L4_PLABR|nr:hypothetical protein MKS88_005887 [Plasmodium brasilianum]
MMGVIKKNIASHSCDKKFFTTVLKNKINYSNKYKHFLGCNDDISLDTLSSKYIKVFNVNNYNFIIYGILHGQINERSCSGKDCSELLKNIKTDYVLFELCEQRLKRIFNIILSKKEKQKCYYNNNYSRLTYLPRIHNGFLQNEFIPVVEECVQKQLTFFLFDRNINTIKNRLDSMLLYDTKAYRKFFTYCIESISLRNYSYDKFTKLFKVYFSSVDKEKNVYDEMKGVFPMQYKHNLKGKREDHTKNLANNKHNENSNTKEEDVKQGSNRSEENTHINTYENFECLKKLNAIKILNERLLLLSKPTYEVLVEEKYKYAANNIWCFLLNNEANFFENKCKKRILVICSINILENLTQELQTTYHSLCKRYNNNKNNANSSNKIPEQLMFENPYSSYNFYVKPHWPLIFIKYYFVPYLILYIALSTFYSFCSWIYRSNFQKSSSFSHKIVDIQV